MIRIILVVLLTCEFSEVCRYYVHVSTYRLALSMSLDMEPPCRFEPISLDLELGECKLLIVNKIEQRKRNISLLPVLSPPTSSSAGCKLCSTLECSCE